MQWLADRNPELDAGNISAIIKAASAYPLDGIKATDMERKLGYFRNNAHRMRYARFQELGIFTGSGAIEGCIKAIVVQHASGWWNDFVAPRPAPAARLRAAT